MNRCWTFFFASWEEEGARGVTFQFCGVFWFRFNMLLSGLQLLHMMFFSVTRSTEQLVVPPVLNCHRPPSHRLRFDLIFETSSEVLPILSRLKLQDINKQYTGRLLVLCQVLTQFTANYLELLRKMHETQLMNSQKSKDTRVCRKDPRRFQTAHMMFSGSQSNKKKVIKRKYKSKSEKFRGLVLVVVSAHQFVLASLFVLLA
jgi:hypothetical protein